MVPSSHISYGTEFQTHICPTPNHFPLRHPVSLIKTINSLLLIRCSHSDKPGFSAEAYIFHVIPKCMKLRDETSHQRLQSVVLFTSGKVSNKTSSKCLICSIFFSCTYCYYCVSNNKAVTVGVEISWWFPVDFPRQL